MSKNSISQRLPAISPLDPLKRYLMEVEKHEMISPEEEIKLVNKMREKGDIRSAKRLVTANLRLVVKIAFEYRNIYVNTLDLIQEGNIGLMKAVSKFDPTKGARLGYYASWWIRSYILKYLLDNFRLVKIGTTKAQQKLFYHLMREKRKLEALGISNTPKLLAKKLDVSEKDVITMESRLSSSGSEVPLTNNKKTDPIQFLSDPESLADDKLISHELLNILALGLSSFEKKLNKREISILNDRILSENPKTLQNIADDYNITRERVRQIEVELIDKLRNHLKEDLKLSM